MGGVVEPERTDRQAQFALRAIVQYLFSCGVKQTKVYEAAKISRQELAYYFRPNHADLFRLADLHVKLMPAVKALLLKQHPNHSYPGYLAGLVDLAFGRDEYISEAHKFLNDHAIKSAYWSEPGFLKRFLERHAGFWRVFRISTETKPEDIDLSVGLLSIWPEAALKGPAPHFVFYHRSRFGDDTDYVRVSGEIIVVSGGLYLVGARSGDGTIFVMSFPFENVGNTEAASDHRRSAWGLVLMTSASGVKIAAHVRALYIPQTMALGEKFEEEKNRYRQEIGVKKLADLAALSWISQKELDDLIEFSRRDLVLRLPG